MYIDFPIADRQSLLIQQTHRTPSGALLWGLACLPTRFLFAVLELLVERWCLAVKQKMIHGLIFIVCVYICVYVCMYIYIYICMHVCTYVCVYICVYLCMYVCTEHYYHYEAMFLYFFEELTIDMYNLVLFLINISAIHNLKVSNRRNILWSLIYKQCFIHSLYVRS